ncbi:MAG: hypothetical protein GXP49_05740 [Deltaproteobacteria bacterium]|nr:hypothetical protein [Deltaproteobacteria bacterium]
MGRYEKLAMSMIFLAMMPGCKSRPWVKTAQEYLDTLEDKDFAKAYGMLDEDSQKAITQAKFEETVKDKLLDKLPYVRIRKYMKSANQCTIETDFTGKMKAHNSDVSAKVTLELTFERGKWRIHLPDAIQAYQEELAKKAEEEAKKQLVAEWKGLLDFKDIKISRYKPTPDEIEMLKAKSPRLKKRDEKDKHYEEVGEAEEKEIEWLQIPWWAVSGEVMNRGQKVVDKAGLYFKFYWKDDPRKRMLYDAVVYPVYEQPDDDPKYNKEVLLPGQTQSFQEVVDLVDLPADWTMDKGRIEWELSDIAVSAPTPEQEKKIEKLKKKAKKHHKKRR